MMNQLVVVGRLASDPEVREQGGKKVSTITLVVQRAYKNADGIYEQDNLQFEMFEGIASNVSEYCHKGDIIGVKGRLQSDENGMHAVAEKVTFLSAKKPEESE